MVTMKGLQHYSGVVGKSAVCIRQCTPLYDVSSHGKEVAGNVSYTVDKHEKKKAVDC